MDCSFWPIGPAADAAFCVAMILIDLTFLTGTKRKAAAQSHLTPKIFTKTRPSDTRHIRPHEFNRAFMRLLPRVFRN